MRINKFVALASGMSRRAADASIAAGKIRVNGEPVTAGASVTDADTITLDNQRLQITANLETIMLHKPPGYVSSRIGQGSRTVYELLPSEFHRLKTVGRLDKDSSGLLILTENGALANQLTHPRFEKTKVYEIVLDKPLATSAQLQISAHTVRLEDGLSGFDLRQTSGNPLKWQATMQEGRNRQIRRTFAALGYRVRKLHRVQFGDYSLGSLTPGTYKIIKT